MRRFRVIAWAGAAAAAAAFSGSLMRREKKPATASIEKGSESNPTERRADPDPEALDALHDGSRMRIGLDLEQLKELNPEGYEPLIEYLTYIQVQRGDSSSLVFVRQRDVESLAEMLHESKDEFMEKFQQLGVMLSMN